MEIPDHCKKILQSKKVRYFIYLDSNTFIKGDVIYIQWLSMEDKTGQEIITSTDWGKLVELGNSTQDLFWGDSCPKKYMAAQAEKLAMR